MTAKNQIRDLLENTYGKIITKELESGETEFVYHADYLDHPFLLIVQIDEAQKLLIMSIMFTDSNADQLLLNQEELKSLKEQYPKYFVDLIDQNLVLTDAINFLKDTYSIEFVEERLSKLEAEAYTILDKIYG
ncbi:hypothetical protein BKP56_10770 [Marinilactibacillus sp. 15R]|uniref:hypothetical protein n=1 Tax=Marinilactibacillus sp. 15R TaxID=1911586 RepID=UPI0009096539|nr:hypothetical protein [Marinilactibacillus sp. 15R]API89711.1 hypothetical protein BKP56_10770 [Marinilactibacillus sp. 15R]